MIIYILKTTCFWMKSHVWNSFKIIHKGKKWVGRVKETRLVMSGNTEAGCWDYRDLLYFCVCFNYANLYTLKNCSQ